jgi:hypothetical protein
MFITPRDGFDIAGQVATPKMKDFCPNYGNKEVNTQNVDVSGICFLKRISGHFRLIER